jgi:hypothetical protein
MNDIAEIAVFDIERNNQEGRSEARQHSERDEDGQQRDVPARTITG